MSAHGTDRIEALLQEALMRGGNLLTIEDVTAMARDAKVQIWGDRDAIAVSEVLTYPRQRVLSIFAVAGELRKLRALEPAIADFAREHGAGSMVCATDREGWARIGRAHNWTPRGVVWERRLLASH